MLKSYIKKKWKVITIFVVCAYLGFYIVQNRIIADWFELIADDSHICETKHENSSEYSKQVINAAKKISKRPVMISLINGGYLDLAFNWLCNTNYMGFHEQVLVIVTNEDAKRQLLSISPTINVVVLTVDNYLDKDQKYSGVGYLRLLMIRTEILKDLIENKIETLLFEFDFLWLKNPLPFFQSYTGRHDMLFTPTYGEDLFLNGGFFYMFPTNTTINVMRTLHRMMRNLVTKIQSWEPDRGVPETQNDQVYITRLFRRKTCGLNGLRLPFEDFPDGMWYQLKESIKGSWKPYTIHNNWIIGNDNKIIRAKQWGYWFVTENNQCDLKKIGHKA